MSLLVCFYAGAIVTSLFKQTLQQGETVVALESIIIGKGISLVGRNVDDYRSLFLPSTVSVGDGSKAKGVVDGAICMRFFRYPPSIQKEIADRFGSSVSDIMETLLKINEI